jgi:hypothetical protein
MCDCRDTGKEEMLTYLSHTRQTDERRRLQVPKRTGVTGGIRGTY